MPVILRTENLTKNFDGLTAVDHINYSLEEGTLGGIIGPNGSGKTTFLNLLSGALPVTEGKIFFHDKDITKLPAYKRVELKIGRTFQLSNSFKRLTVLHNIMVGLVRWQQREVKTFALTPISRHTGIIEEADRILEDTYLISERDTIVSNLSHGSQRRLEIAICLSTKPELLLLDEPMAGLTGEEMDQMLNFIVKDLKAKHTAIVIEHRLDALMKMADRITVLSQGGIVVDGTAEEIRNSRAAQEAYLGVKH